jgi:hypothetical protein
MLHHSDQQQYLEPHTTTNGILHAVEFYYEFSMPVEFDATFNSERALVVPNIALNIKDPTGGLVITVRDETDVFWAV